MTVITGTLKAAGEVRPGDRIHGRRVTRVDRYKAATAIIWLDDETAPLFLALDEEMEVERGM